MVREIYRMLAESRKLAPAAAMADMPPYGFNAMRKPLELASAWAYDQKIIPRRISVDELSDETTASL